MKKKERVSEVENYEQLNTILIYLLAGLTGCTDGYELVSVTVQQADLSAYRVVLRASDNSGSGDPIRLVGFTSGHQPASALLLAEEGYRDNLIRWSVDKFAKGLIDNGSSKIKKARLTIND